MPRRGRAANQVAVHFPRPQNPGSAPWTAEFALSYASTGFFPLVLKIFPLPDLRPLDCFADMSEEGRDMMVAAGLAVLVGVCLLLSMVQKPPEIGR